MFETGKWLWSIEHRQPCKVIETSSLWDDIACHVWFPATNSVVRIPADRLESIDTADANHPSRIRYVLYAAKIANLLSEGVLLAPSSASVIPLPHQLKALSRAISQDRVRFLLADEVGLGKTCSAITAMSQPGTLPALVVTLTHLPQQWKRTMQVAWGGLKVPSVEG
jgi:SNF2 family DNA or RNA helicase